jgi:hypothetical protein
MAARELESSADAQLLTMKREIDALQIEAARVGAKWYRQVPVVVSVLVSVLALAFSFGTTLLSEKRLAREDDHAARTELRSLIQRLTTLPKENFELTENYAKNPVAVQQLSGFINAENAVLSKQAAELTKQIANDVTAIEYYAIAVALANSGLSGQSGELVTRGLDAAKDAQEETTLLRQYGQHLFAIGELEAGRERYRQAMEVFRHYPEENADVVAQTHLFTQMFWADAELAKGECREAWSHFDTSRRYLVKTSGFEPQHGALRKRIELRCGPSPGL